MNPKLTPEESAACLEILYRGLIHIRLDAIDGKTDRVEAVADALHNLPHLLSVGHERDWDLDKFRQFFLAPLIERFPDLAGLSQPLDELP
jgi:hypothetical protein